METKADGCSPIVNEYYYCRRRRDDILFSNIEKFDRNGISKMNGEQKKVHRGML